MLHASSGHLKEAFFHSLFFCSKNCSESECVQTMHKILAYSLSIDIEKSAPGDTEPHLFLSKQAFDNTKPSVRTVLGKYP